MVDGGERAVLLRCCCGAAAMVQLVAFTIFPSNFTQHSHVQSLIRRAPFLSARDAPRSLRSPSQSCPP